MLRFLIFVFVLLCSSIVFAQDSIVGPAGTYDWLDWDVLSGGYEFSGGTGTSDDSFNFADGAKVTQKFSAAFSANGCLIIENGAHWYLDMTDTPVVVTTGAGCSVGGYTNVGFYSYPTSGVHMQGGFHTIGLASPEIRTEITGSNSVIWKADLFGECGANAASLGNGNDGLCDAQENQFLLWFSNARNNPADGATGDNFLQESFSPLSATYNFIRFLSGGEKGNVFAVIGYDKITPDFAIRLDPTQLFKDASVAVPLAERQIVSGEVDNVDTYFPRKGDRCIQTEEDTVITADGMYVSRCIRLGGNTGNGDRDPFGYRITKSLNDYTCAMTTPADGDAIWISPETPLVKDYHEEAFYAIGPCINQGDEFVIEARAQFVDGTTNNDTDGMIVNLSTDIEMDVVTLAGPKSALFNGAHFTSCSNLHIFDGGVDSTTPSLEFLNMSYIDCPYLSVTGGPGDTATYLQVDIEGVLGARFEHSAFNYRAGYSIRATGSANGFLSLSDVNFSFSDSGTAVVYSGAGNYWKSASIVDARCYSCLPEVGSAIAYGIATNPDIEINGLLVLGGLTGPGMSNNPTSIGVKMFNLYARDNVWTRSGATTFLPLRLDRFDLRGLSINNPLWVGYSATAGWLRNGIAGDISTDDTTIFHASLGASANNITMFGSVTSNACGINVCSPFRFTSSSSPASLTEISVVWDDAEETVWDQGILISGDSGGDFRLGKLLVEGLQTDIDGESIYGIYADTPSLLTDHTTFEGNFCVSQGYNDGTGTFTPVEPIANFSPLPLLGHRADFVDPTRDNYVLKSSFFDGGHNCGALGGLLKPGIEADRMKSIAEAMMMPWPYMHNTGQSGCVTRF